MPVRPGRGRPRSETVERAIIESVLRLLEEGVPLAELSIEGIARAAGVGKATIYRRWEGKEALFVDVLVAMEEPEPPLPGTSVRDDLVAILEGIRRRGLAKRSSAMMHSVVGQARRYPRLWEQYHRTVVDVRRHRMDAVLRRGIADGELRGDLTVELLGDILAGPMLTRTLLRTDSSLDEGLSETLVDALLAGLRPSA
ncbi:TetR family transcriptional regulator [Streptomyces sp. GC420]|nr:TetR family transcriptional regulator [Streptomyces sp. GC420]